MILIEVCLVLISWKIREMRTPRDQTPRDEKFETRSRDEILTRILHEKCREVARSDTTWRENICSLVFSMNSSTPLLKESKAVSLSGYIPVSTTKWKWRMYVHTMYYTLRTAYVLYVSHLEFSRDHPRETGRVDLVSSRLDFSIGPHL